MGTAIQPLNIEYVLIDTTTVQVNLETGIVSGVVLPGGEPMTIYANSLEEAQDWVERAGKVKATEEARKAFRDDLVAHIRAVMEGV